MGASFDYTFDTSTANSDPGTGKIRLSNSTQTSAAEAYIDITDDNSNSIQSFLLSIKAVTSAIKGHMRIASRTDSTQFLLYPIDDLTDNTGWWTLDLDTISSSGGSAFINNQDILISFTTVGDRGDTGQKGAQGTQGPQGLQGIQGNTGLQGLQGITGAKGAQGTQGITGDIGLQGLQGITGTKGAQGTQGITGTKGAQGTQGITGTTGLQGLQGITG